MSITPGWPVALAVVLLLAMVLAAYVVGGLPRPALTLTAAGRAVVQLGVAALLITAVVSHLGLSVALLAAMFAVAVATSGRRVGAGSSWPWVALSMASGLLPVAGLILLSGAVPLTGSALIPVVGIVLGGTMTAHTLVGRRAFAALREERGALEAGLSIGLERPEAMREVLRRRTPEALVPGLDQVRTAGVVTLPGAFIGVLLGGGSPVEAATAQVLVLVGILAAQSTTVVVAEHLISRGLLLPADLAAQLPV